MGGLNAGYILHDASNPGIWPQLVVDHPNLAGAEISASDFQKAYLIYGFENKSALEFVLDKDPSRTFLAGPDTLDFVPGGYNRLNAIYGWNMSDMLLGVGVTYTGKSLKHDATGRFDKRDASYSTFGANLGITALEKKLDASLGFEFASFTDKVGGVEVSKNDGSMLVKFAGRYWYQANDKYALIPNVKFLTKKDGMKNAAGKASLETTNFAVGVGNNWTPVEDMLAIFEVGVMSLNNNYKTTTSTKDTEFDIYWRMGFESKIFDWLNGRLGAERSWESAKYKSELGSPEYTTAVTNTYLGATAHWNRLVLDLVVKPEFLQNGPNFISGKTSDMFSQVSLFYNFNK
jgi:hypothetical protein